MARLHDIPPNTSEQEKAIGGVLTFIQFFWILGGVILALLTYVLIYLMCKIHIVAIFPAIIVSMSGLPFAFYKKKEMTLFTYLSRKSKFNKKTKKLINRKVL